jgi:hypothetical protein
MKRRPIVLPRVRYRGGPVAERCKWAQAEFAGRCELYRTFIGSVERSERNLSVLNLRRNAKVLRVCLADLFKGLI